MDTRQGKIAAVWFTDPLRIQIVDFQYFMNVKITYGFKRIQKATKSSSIFG
jgi:hypothetical protein